LEDRWSNVEPPVASYWIEVGRVEKKASGQHLSRLRGGLFAFRIVLLSELLDFVEFLALPACPNLHIDWDF